MDYSIPKNNCICSNSLRVFETVRLNRRILVEFPFVSLHLPHFLYRALSWLLVRSHCGESPRWDDTTPYRLVFFRTIHKQYMLHHKDHDCPFQSPYGSL